MLSNPQNKANIGNFVMTNWLNTAKDKLSENQTLYLAGGFKDQEKVVAVTNVHEFYVRELESDHEAADSCMFLHIKHATDVHQAGLFYGAFTQMLLFCVLISVAFLGCKASILKLALGRRSDTFQCMKSLKNWVGNYQWHYLQYMP